MVKKFNFSNFKQEKISGRIDLPEGQPPKSFALFAHCFSCSKNLTVVVHIAKALNQMGIAVLRFDFTGLGDSEGQFADTNFTSNVEELIAGAEALKQEYMAPKIIIGHSIGGTAALYAAGMIDSIEAVVTIGSPFTPSHVKHLFSSNLEVIKKENQAEVNLGGRTLTIKNQFLEDIDSIDMANVIPNLKKALLILHSPQDTVVTIDNAANIYQHAKHPKSFVSLDGANHFLNNKQDSLYVGNLISSWVDRYLSPADQSTVESSEPSEQGAPSGDNQPHFTVVTATIGEKHYTTKINANGHPLVADEPQSLGGTNLGPGPYLLLLSSLGACTVITLQMYLSRKQWSVKEISVDVSFAIESGKENYQHIVRKLSFKGNLDEEQQQQVVNIANKCPVHKILEKSHTITTEMKG